MKKSFKINKVKTKSLDNNSVNRIKKVFRKKRNNQSMKDVNISQLKNEFSTIIDPNKDNDKISILSNANINIIKILTTCLNDDLYKEISFAKTEQNKNDENIPKSNFSKIKSNKIKKIYNSNICSQKRISFMNPKRKNSIFLSEISDLSKNNKNKSGEKNKKINNRFGKYNSTICNSDEINIKLKNNNKNKNINISNKPRQRSKSILFNEKYNKKKNDLLLSEFNTNLSNMKLEGYKNFLNEIEIMQINKNIQNDANFIQLRNKISKFKKEIQLKYSTNNLRQCNSNKNLLNSQSINEDNNSNKDINNKKKKKIYKSKKQKKNQ